MARTTVSAVQVLLETGGDYDSTVASPPSLAPFVEIATLLVDRIATCATSRGVPLTDTELEILERWLAAHFYAQADPTYASKKTENASATFTGKTGMYLTSTRYGQSAVALDWSGCLASIAEGARPNVGLTWLGKPPSSQIDYVDRD